MRRKSIVRAMLVGALMSVMMIALAGCQSDGISFPGFGAGKISLSNATMCKSVDLETGQPVETGDTFSAADGVIFCSVKVSNATPATVIGAEWLYLPAGADDEAGLLVSSWSTTMEGTGYIPLSIMRPENGWPQGDYEVVFYLDDKEALSVPFTVE
ncbi:MAG: hypothetical protein PHY18_04545 [Dehalococcoidales bacterium]|nr:hypothetical protein [Dehalococcoidales bacterium]